MLVEFDYNTENKQDLDQYGDNDKDEALYTISGFRFSLNSRSCVHEFLTSYRLFRVGSPGTNYCTYRIQGRRHSLLRIIWNALLLSSGPSDAPPVRSGLAP